MTWMDIEKDIQYTVYLGFLTKTVVNPCIFFVFVVHKVNIRYMLRIYVD